MHEQYVLCVRSGSEIIIACLLATSTTTTSQEFFSLLSLLLLPSAANSGNSEPGAAEAPAHTPDCLLACLLAYSHSF